MKKNTFIILLFFTISIAAQDVIVKKDQSEIKAKVLEITESSIKYKKWKSQDGPTYNIKKSEVFMIIYTSGEKEYYNSKEEVVVSNYRSINQNTISTNQSTITNTNTSSDDFIYRDVSKVNIGFAGVGYSGFDVYSLGYSISGSISPIDYNTAIEMDFLFAATGGEFLDSSLLMYSIGLGVGYGIFFNESFKISAGIGYAYNYGTITSDSIYVDDLDVSFGGFYYYSNFDYFLSDSFGINLRYDYVMGTSFGVIWEF